MKKVLTFLVLLGILYACDTSENNSSKFEYVSREPILDTIFSVQANDETDPVNASSGSDAADDPAVWIHPDSPSESIIYGSNKTGGIAAYDLSGAELGFFEVGRINNIDVAYSLDLSDRQIDICGGTNRTKNAIDLFEIDGASGNLSYILREEVKSGVNEVYGFCFYHSPVSAKNYAILCGKDGVIEQYEILEGNEKLDLNLVRSFDIGSQPEGLVADHKHGVLFIGVENEAIWRVTAEPTGGKPVKLEMSSEEDNQNIEYDIEGLTIYYTSSDHGYLIASSQGNDTYAIYDRFVENAYIGSFEIVDGVFDGTTETDGIDVINLNLGGDYKGGLLIAQDDRNVTNSEILPQNFKIVDWQEIANLFDPPLYIDPDFNVRTFFED